MKRLDLARQVLRDTESRLGLEKNQDFSDFSKTVPLYTLFFSY